MTLGSFMSLGESYTASYKMEYCKNTCFTECGISEFLASRLYYYL